MSGDISRNPPSHERFLLIGRRVKLSHKEYVQSAEQKNARTKESNWLKKD
jgi:hypothetical protein